MINEIQPIDPHLIILMQWLKDNDESAASIREHANQDSQYIPDVLEDGTDSYD